MEQKPKYEHYEHQPTEIEDMEFAAYVCQGLSSRIIQRTVELKVSPEVNSDGED